MILFNVLQRCLFVIIILISACFIEVNAADIFNGEKKYNHSCLNCHGVSGKGGMPGIPDLTRINVLMKSDNQLVQRFRNGKGGCPPFAALLKDKDLADITAYLRTMRH